MNYARRLAGVGALALGAIVVSLVVVEILLRVAAPAPTAYRMLLPGSKVFEPDLRFVHGIHGPANYVVNQHGIRGRDFGADSLEYRLLLVGGSTTECGMLDDHENWGAVAERDLHGTRDGRAVWVGNVGRSGLTSRDHFVTIKYLLPQYPRIDLIVVLVGVNDLTAALRQGDAYRSPPPLSDPAVEAVQVRNAFALSPGGFREMLTSDFAPERTAWYKRTRIFQLAKQARTGFQARQVVQGIGGAILGQWRNNRRSASRLIEQAPDLARPLADYRRSLESIVAEARRANTEIVFMTQPSLWKRGISPAEEQKLWLGGTGNFQEEPGHAYFSVPALADAMHRYNAELLSVCQAQKLSCFDLAAALPADTTMFYDDVHFTEAGAAAVGKLLSAHLRVTRPDLFATLPKRSAVSRDSAR